MTEEDVQVAQTLIKDPDTPAKQIAETPGVSRTTLYRHVAPDGDSGSRFRLLLPHRAR